MLSNKYIHVSSAGSGKTTYLVNNAINEKDRKGLITTYTIENLNEIHNKFISKNQCIPKNIEIMSWYSFLIRECARPYQNFLYEKNRIESLFFVEGKSALYAKKSNVEKYFFYDGKYIYSDKISEFIIEINKKSNGLVIQRLEQQYDFLCIDEIQDLAGYDLDIIELLLESSIEIHFVGDPRQGVFSTNNSAKYKRFRGESIADLFKEWEIAGKCQIIDRNFSYRCHQTICQFADNLYPNYPRTKSKLEEVVEHTGIFFIKLADLEVYLKKYNPVVLRYSKSTNFLQGSALNFGSVKGLTFDRVLILPNGPIKDFLKLGKIEKLATSTKSKLYVAITRAKFSVAFLYESKSDFKNIAQYQNIP